MAIDLRSDTVTSPTAAMRQAMANAAVGDDVYEEDPTVKELERLGARLTGKESGLFVSSGTMGNLVAVLTHCQSGQEIYLDKESHIYFYEAGGMSALGGFIPRLVDSGSDLYNPVALEAAWRPENIHFPTPGLLCLENTHNRSGGKVIGVDRMKEAALWARNKGLPVHLDGARIFNAAYAMNLEVKELTTEVDTAMFCLSKGLGAPVGSLLVGSEEWIAKARKWRKMVGGGLRQVGVLAAAGLVALEQREQLLEDHKLAKLLAKGLTNIKGISVDLSAVDTNIFMADLEDERQDAYKFAASLAEAGLLANAVTSSRMRFVTHYDVNEEQIDEAINIAEKVISTI